MTKIATLVLAGVVSLGLSACSGSEPANVAADNSADAGAAGEDTNLSVVDDAALGDNAVLADNAAGADAALGNDAGNAADLNASGDANASGNAL